MKKFYRTVFRTDRKYEVLSAYIDNELSESEIKKLEEELKFSKELQDELAQLKKIKQLTSASVKRIAENPYFETRLAATMRIDKPFLTRMKKLSPVSGVIFVSLILMIVLKYNPQIVNNLVEQQKTNITAFYKQNLKPLLYAANLSNEDIFNFAFDHKLPLDNNKSQFLQLGSDKSGNQFFEIKAAGVTPKQNNLEKFTEAMNLNQHQKAQMDSILQSYGSKLQSQVLVNEKNTVAINPNIWNFSKALAADLISFASKANKERFAEVVPHDFQNYYNSGRVSNVVSQVKSQDNDKYIFLTPDSIFSDSYTFDEKKFNDEMKKWSGRFKRNMENFSKQMDENNFSFHFNNDFTRMNRGSGKDKRFHVFVDSNGCRVHLSKIFIPPVEIPNIDSLISYIDSVTGMFGSDGFNFNKPKGKNYNYKYFYNDSSKGYNFDFKAFGFDSTYGFPNNRKIDSLFISRNPNLRGKFKNFNFPMNPDSFAEMFKSFFSDSTNVTQQKQLQRQMKEFQKEMERFRKEMENLQKQFRQNDSIPRPKKPVEI